MRLSVVFAGAGTEAPPPGEAGHSSPEPEKQNQQPGNPQRYHRAQYVTHSGAVIETNSGKRTQEPCFFTSKILEFSFGQPFSLAL